MAIDVRFPRYGIIWNGFGEGIGTATGVSESKRRVSIEKNSAKQTFKVVVEPEVKSSAQCLGRLSVTFIHSKPCLAQSLC